MRRRRRLFRPFFFPFSFLPNGLSKVKCFGHVRTQTPRVYIIRLYLFFSPKVSSSFVYASETTGEEEKCFDMTSASL